MPESNTRWPAYARVPPFLPVPLRARRDGWTVARQAHFIGYLAETGSVAAAARRVGMSRMGAWRLRRRAGAESLAHAWDAVMALHARVDPASVTFPRRKVTPGELAEHAYDGPIVVHMRRGRYAGAQREPNANALIRHLKRLDAAAARYGWDWGDPMPGEAAR